MTHPDDFVDPGSLVRLSGGTLDLSVLYSVPLYGWRRWLYRLTCIAWPKRRDLEAIRQRREDLQEAFEERFEGWT